MKTWTQEQIVKGLVGYGTMAGGHWKVWDGVEPGASLWDRSSVYFEKLTMASGRSREGVSDLVMPSGDRELDRVEICLRMNWQKLLMG